MTMPTNAEPHVYIDWYADGSFDEAFDDMTDRVMGRPGITVSWGRDSARSTAPPMIGAADCVLDNQDRMLSPENPASPAYQFIKPGRPALVTVGHGERRLLRSHWLLRSHVPLRGVGVWPLLVGHLDRFDQHPEFGARTVGMAALDRGATLLRKRISVAIMAGTLRTDTAVAAVLDAVGWPVDNRVLHISDSLLNGWWVDDRPAWDVLVELLATEGAGAAFYIDGFGIFHWLNRNHRITEARSTTTQAAFHDGTATGIPYSHVSYDPRWDDIVDRVTITTQRREMAGSPTVIWQLGTEYEISGGISETITVRPSDPALLAIPPVEGVDYTVSGGTVSVDLSWTDGAVFKLYIRGISGAITISDLQLRGQSFPVVGVTDFEASAGTVPEGQEKVLKIAAWPMLDPAQAQTIAESYLTRYSESHPVIELTFQNVDGDTMEKILDLRISDRIEITNQFLGLVSVPCYVETITHAMTVGGRYEVTIACEPTVAVGSFGAVWDSGVWDTDVWGV